MTEVVMRFKPPLHAVLDENVASKDCYFRFRLGPDEAIALGIQRKKPGEKMVGQSEELILHESSTDEKPPYQRLLGDATRGDATLFAREDSVEAAWRIVDPILGPSSSVPQYEPNTWGPTVADNRIEPEGGWLTT
jgi:glucose-6-phosphate 1-dehydrogenase